MDLVIFFRGAVYTIASALVLLLDWEIQPEVHGRPRHRIRKSLKRRCMGKMRRLAVLIRRLIFLMALSLELAPAAPREGRNWFRDEPVPGARRWKGLRTIPGKSGVFSGCVRASSGHLPEPRVVPIAPVIERWDHLIDALTHSHRRARRLARTLARWKAQGEARPYLAPLRFAHRWPVHVALVAGAVTARLEEAFRRWPDTG